MKDKVRISDAEWEVMKVVWKRSPCFSQDIIKALSGGSKWRPATIKTLLNRLTAKGALRFEKVGNSYLYSSAYTEEECRAVEVNSFLKRVFDGALSPMIAHFVDSRQLTSKEVSMLKALLRKQGKSHE